MRSKGVNSDGKKAADTEYLELGEKESMIEEGS